MSVCVRCRTIFDGEACLRCLPAALAFKLAYSVCLTNRCGHYVYSPRRGCELHPGSACRIDGHLLRGGGCLADPPRFGPVTIPKPSEAGKWPRTSGVMIRDEE